MINLSELEGIVHLQTGEKVCFRLIGVDVIRGVLETAQHGRVFERESLILAASHRLAIVRPEAMVQIDLLSGEALDAVTFDPALKLISAQEISEETWQKAQELLELMTRRREDVVKTPGRVIHVLGEFRLVDGRAVRVHYELQTPREVEQHRFLQDFFKIPKLPFNRLEGGVALINPRQVTAATFYPGALSGVDTWRVYDFSIRACDARGETKG
jgi:hypothetical protein